MPTACETLASASRRSLGTARRLLSGIRAFGRDRRGLAAMEFAFVLPILLMFYLAAFEGSRGFDALHKTSAVAETTGNLVTRLSSVSTTEMANIFTLSSAIMSPFTGDPKVVVTAVRVDANGIATVVWSKASTRNSDGTMGVKEGLLAGSPYTLPADLAAQKSTFFVASTATYSFKVVANYADIIKDQDLVQTNIFRPRVGDEISWVS